MKNVAFFGLGNMGLPIALNLVNAGYNVTTAIHQSDKGPLALKAAGGKIAASKTEAVKNADLIFSIVSDDAALKALLLENEMIDAVPAGSVIIEMTSASPQAVQDIASAYERKGVFVIDAPVSGGVKGAAAATMTMMCGGDPDVFERIKPDLETIGKNILYLGAVGTGKAVKSVNNLLGAIHKIAMAESIKIIEKNGVDPEVFYDAIVKSTGNSLQFQRDFYKVLARDYTPTFTLGLMKKDMGLALDLAKDVYTPISRLALDMFEKASPYAGEDTGAIMRVLDGAL